MILLKRMQGTPKELSDFKKGKRFSTIVNAETELWKMSRTAPIAPDSHRVAYEVSLDDEYLTGTILLSRNPDPLAVPADLREIVARDYGKERARIHP